MLQDKVCFPIFLNIPKMKQQSLNNSVNTSRANAYHISDEKEIADTASSTEQVSFSPPPFSLSSSVIQRQDDETESSQADVDDFSQAFNQEFAAQLHVFSSNEESAAEQGPDVNAAHIGRASGEPVAASRLRQLFTNTQIEKLSQFINTRQIPDRLFNGDDVGETTAQQRIILSGHILATGEYRPGSFSQRMYARMCGHWANLVLHYAGAGNAAGRGIREQFDHEGNFSLSTGRRESWTGARIAEDEYVEGDVRPERSRFQMRGLSWDELNNLQSGDWIWYFNDNGGGGGNHSVIFSRWASGEMQTHDSAGRLNRYRRAICVSQRNPANGGVEHTALLGERFMRTEANHRITPVTHYSRVSPDANPIRTAQDLQSMLGTGRDAQANQRFINRLMRRYRGRHLNWEALAEELRQRNNQLLQQLNETHRTRMTTGQVTAMTDLNNQALRENSENTDITALVHLNSRLQVWIANADTLSESETSQSERVERNREETRRETAPERSRLEQQIEGFDQEIDGYENVQDEAEEQIDILDVSREWRDAIREKRRLRQADRELRQRRRGTRDEVLRADIDRQRSELRPLIEEAEAEVDRLTEAQRNNRPELRAAQRLARRQNGNIRRANNRRNNAVRQLNRLAQQEGIYRVHPGNRQTFQGRGESRRGGQLSTLAPQPDWAQLMEAG